jgi:hypothetical protein
LAFKTHRLIPSVKPFFRTSPSYQMYSASCTIPVASF